MLLCKNIIGNDGIEGDEIVVGTAASEVKSSVSIAPKENDNASTTMLQFRDGDHSGEAPLEDIITGYDDGELSDQCVVYDYTSDSWLRITSYIDTVHSAGEEKKEEHFDIEESKDVDENLPEATFQPLSFIEMEQIDDFQIVSKNDRKKPKRDISAWGKGQVQSLISATELNESKENEISMSRRKKSKHIKPPAKLMRLCTQAMIQWDMLEDGDRLLLGLSGGKDSMSLLHVLLEFQKKLPIRFEIEVSQLLFNA